MGNIVASLFSSSRHASPISRLMDSIYAIGLGLSLRFVIDTLSHHDVRLSGSLVGLWEGVVLYHFVEKMPRSFDPYVGFGVRLFVDFLFTESVAKLTVVMLWTGLGMLLSDLGPALSSTLRLGHYYRRLSREMRHLGLPKIRLPFLGKRPRVRIFSPPPSSNASSITSSSASPISRLPSLLSRSSRPSQLSQVSRSSLPSRPPQPPQTSRPTRRRPPGAFPGDWSETESDSVTILPIPPPSLRPSPRTFHESVVYNDGLSSDEDDDNGSTVEIPPGLGRVVPPTPTMPEIPEEDTHHYPLDVDLNPIPTDPLLDTYEVVEPQPALVDIPDMAPAPSQDPPPAFEDVYGEDDRREGASSYLDPNYDPKKRPESVLSGMSSGALLQRAEACRQAALDEEKERDTFEELRKQAMAAGRKKDAFLLKKEWDEADGRARVLHAKADERHFRARNVPSDLENIDLRYLSIPEARRRLEARVRDVLAQDGTRIRVRVGGGTGNTIDKAYVLTHALVEAMSDHHIQAEADRDDRQYVVVTLPSS